MISSPFNVDYLSSQKKIVHLLMNVSLLPEFIFYITVMQSWVLNSSKPDKLKDKLSWFQDNWNMVNLEYG